MPEFNLARTFRNRGLLLQTGSQFSNSAAAISSIIAIILGYLGTVFGAEIMNWPQLGPILAIVVMGSAIITSLEKEK